MPSFLKSTATDPKKRIEYPVAKELVMIGRGPDSDICLDDGAVSRVHARIRFDGERFMINDMASSNGTFVNDRPITAPTVLYDGDRVRIGRGEFVFVTDFAKSKRPDSSQHHSTDSAILDESLSKDSINFTSQVDLRSRRQFSTVRQPSLDLMEQLKTLQMKLDAMMSMMKNWRRVTNPKELLPEFFVNLLTLFPQTDVVSLLCPDDKTSKLKLVDFRLRNGPSDTPIRISRSIPQYVFDNEKAIISASPDRDPRFNAEEDSALTRDVYSAMAVPIFAGENEPPIGVILVESRTGAAQFTDSDLDLLIGIANQISLYAENLNYQEIRHQEELLEQEMELATQVQRALLPEDTPEFPGYAFFDYYHPAKSVGGDFYDFIHLPNGRLATVLADVTGKGVPAALLAAKLSSDIQAALMMEKTPAEALGRINRLYHTHQIGRRFITMVLLILEPNNGKIHLFNAGHDTPFIRRKDGTIEEVGFGKHGFPLAVAPEIDCREVTATLQPHDAFIMMTDGIQDAVDGNQNLFGPERVKRYLEGLKTSDPTEMGEGLVAEVQRFAGTAPQADDQCVVIVGRVPETKKNVSRTPESRAEKAPRRTRGT